MRLSTVTLFILANGIAAMPWSSKTKDEFTSVLSGPSPSVQETDKTSKSLNIKVSQAPLNGHDVFIGSLSNSGDAMAAKAKPGPVEVDMCWRLCSPEELACPGDWVSNYIFHVQPPLY